MPRLGPYDLKNPYMLAPMAGVSEQPFRALAFRMGASLCPTELVSSEGLMRLNARTIKYLRFDSAVERPYCLQIFGGSPEVMARAAVVAKQHGAEIVDINMGCPVKKVTRNGSGSNLLCDPPRAGEIVRQVREATGLPVTCKIRSGWDESRKNYLEVARVLFENGCAAVAIHARTRAQLYSGKADWSVIADLKRHFPSGIIIGNGDVKTVADARRMTETTGCDFVMIGRGALGNPWLFRELCGGAPPSAEERAAVVLAHFREHVAFASNPLAGVRSFRHHHAWYSHGLRGAAAFRAEVNRLDAPEQVEASARTFFAQANADPSGGTGDPEIDYRAALG
jgi:tRNA-dihydrouridine synthase B